MRKFALIIILLGLSSVALAVEEDLDLDNESPKTTATNTTQVIGNSLSKFSLMGRIDLTLDRTNNDDSELKNNHFLLFLKLKASEKVSVTGEFVESTFYNVDYKPNSTLTAQFGKILVPFGDPRFYHHYYGGIRGYGVNGVMFRNIWAEPGINLNWNLSFAHIDTYWVNTATATSITNDVDLKAEATTERQALGARIVLPLGKWTIVTSGYGGQYWPGRNLYIGGFDAYGEYGSLGESFRHWSISLGTAKAWVEGSPTGRNFYIYGDYFQINTNLLSPVDLRLRYGTYDNDSRLEDQDDTQSLALGAQFPVDVMKVLTEYQLNFEARNEIDNDTFRLLVSLDF